MVKYAAAFLLVCAILFSPAPVVACDHGCHQTGRYAQPQHQRPHMTTVVVQVANAADDGYSLPASSYFEQGGAGSTLAGRLIVSGVANAYHRFLLAIPQGATISAATLRYPSATEPGTARLKIYAESTGDTAAPTTFADVTARTLTTTGVDWDGPFVAGSITSPDIAAVIQEVVTAGAITTSLIIFVEDDGSAAGNNFLQNTDYDTDPSVAAELTITYTTAAATEPSGGTPHGYHNSGLMRPQGGLMPLPGRH